MTQAKEKVPTIWCLFSVENNYDQPENNLDAWWQERPSIEKLGRYLCCPLDKSEDDDVVGLVAIWKGHATRLSCQGDTSYRLVEVPEGGV